MEDLNKQIVQQEIESRIYRLRGMQVMLDSHLSELYGVKTKQLNRAVKRNLERFPKNYRFQLDKQEYESLMYLIRSRCQSGTLNELENAKVKRGQNLKYLPYVFNEQGVAMLLAILHSETAIKVSIQIINAFVDMRKYLMNNAGLLQRVEKVESKIVEYDSRFEQIFSALESHELAPKQNIFFNGQIYDAYSIIVHLIEKADHELILIDNYVDNSVLDMLTKKKKGVTAKIFTQHGTRLLNTDIQKFNQQFPTLKVELTNNMHDRFLLIDQTELYHIGASLKDLGKKCFALSLMEDKNLINNLLNKI